MKKLLVVIAMLLWCVSYTHAQTSEPKPVKDTIVNNIKYPLYVGAKGGRYIIVVSHKTGKPYKRYFPKG